MPVLVDPVRTPPTALSSRGAAFLSLLESARDKIARRLVQDHHAIPDPDLNSAIISSILDLLFLKSGQERGFVEPGTLSALAACNGIAGRMERACSDAGLPADLFFEQGAAGFRRPPALSDEPLREIIHRLDMPEVPAFGSGLTVEELAAILDRFLGTRMQITEGYRVSRAGKSALLYTGTIDVPEQSVIEQVVSRIDDAPGIAAEENRSVRVLDPACGSGLFLLAAYRFLVKKHTRHPGRPDEAGVVQEDLVCRSLFGTDIDQDSVSATRFVLLSAWIDEMKRVDPAISPGRIHGICASLKQTIRCGNALIGPDYFSGKPAFPYNAEERRKVNPFDWKEAFPAILAEGGFDAVIGAPPPYRPFAVKSREEYFQTHYDTYAVSAGLYGYFIEKGLGLLRPGGALAVLVPGTFLRVRAARPLRRLLLTRQIERIACTGRIRVLGGEQVMMYILAVRNKPPAHPLTVIPGPLRSEPQEIQCGRHEFLLDQRSLDDGGWKLDDTRTTDLLEKIRKNGTRLDSYVMGEIVSGTHRIRNNPLVVDTGTRDRLAADSNRCRRFFIPLLRPAEIRRYVPVSPARFVIPAKAGNLRKCPALYRYLSQAKAITGPETVPEPGGELANIDESGTNSTAGHGVPKIIFSPYQRNPAFSFDPRGMYALPASLLAVPRNDPYLAAILNSSLGRFIIMHSCPFTDRGYHTSPEALGKFPVIVPDFEKFSDRNRHDKICALVSEILSLTDYLHQARTGQEQRLVQQEIDRTDVRIDALVYALYGLTRDEIAVVEDTAGREILRRKITPDPENGRQGIPGGGSPF